MNEREGYIDSLFQRYRREFEESRDKASFVRHAKKYVDAADAGQLGAGVHGDQVEATRRFLSSISETDLEVYQTEALSRFVDRQWWQEGGTEYSNDFDIDLSGMERFPKYVLDFLLGGLSIPLKEILHPNYDGKITPALPGPFILRTLNLYQEMFSPSVGQKVDSIQFNISKSVLEASGDEPVVKFPDSLGKIKYIPTPHGWMPVCSEESLGVSTKVTLDPEDPLKHRINCYLSCLGDIQFVRHNDVDVEGVRRCAPTEKEKQFLSRICPLPKPVLQEIEKAPSDCVDIVFRYVTDRFQYVVHSGYRALLNEFSGDIPLIVNELGIGHCALIAHMSVMYLRQVGVSAVMIDELPTNGDGTQFRAISHVSVGIYDTNGLNRHNPTNDCIFNRALCQPYFPDDEYTVLATQLRAATSIEQKRIILQSFTQILAKYTKELGKDEPTSQLRGLLEGLADESVLVWTEVSRYLYSNWDGGDEYYTVPNDEYLPVEHAFYRRLYEVFRKKRSSQLLNILICSCFYKHICKVHVDGQKENDKKTQEDSPYLLDYSYAFYSFYARLAPQEVEKLFLNEWKTGEDLEEYIKDTLGDIRTLGGTLNMDVRDFGPPIESFLFSATAKKRITKLLAMHPTLWDSCLKTWNAKHRDADLAIEIELHFFINLCARALSDKAKREKIERQFAVSENFWKELAETIEPKLKHPMVVHHDKKLSISVLTEEDKQLVKQESSQPENFTYVTEDIIRTSRIVEQFLSAIRYQSRAKQPERGYITEPYDPYAHDVRDINWGILAKTGLVMARRKESELSEQKSLCVFIDSDIADTVEIAMGTLRGILLGIQKFAKQTNTTVYISGAGFDAFVRLPTDVKHNTMLARVLMRGVRPNAGNFRFGFRPTTETRSMPLVYVSANEGRMAAVASQLPKSTLQTMNTRALDLDVHPLLSDATRLTDRSVVYRPLHLSQTV